MERRYLRTYGLARAKGWTCFDTLYLLAPFKGGSANRELEFSNFIRDWSLFSKTSPGSEGPIGPRIVFLMELVAGASWLV